MKFSSYFPKFPGKKQQNDLTVAKLDYMVSQLLKITHQQNTNNFSEEIS